MELVNTYGQVVFILMVSRVPKKVYARVRMSDLYVVAVGTDGRMWELDSPAKIFEDTSLLKYSPHYNTLFRPGGFGGQIVGLANLEAAVTHIHETNTPQLRVGAVTFGWRKLIGLFALVVAESARFYPVMDVFSVAMMSTGENAVTLSEKPWIGKSCNKWQRISLKAKRLPLGEKGITVYGFDERIEEHVENVLNGNDNRRAKGMIAVPHIS